MKYVVFLLLLLVTSCATQKNRKSVTKTDIQYDISGKTVTKKEFFDSAHRVKESFDKWYFSKQSQ
jgi:hypothetical protein